MQRGVFKKMADREPAAAAAATSRGNFQFKWTREQTEAFIRLRCKHKERFTGGKDTAAQGYKFIIEKLGLQSSVTPAQARKKWDNLKSKYKDCKCPKAGQGPEGGGPTAATWPFFSLMEEALGQSAAASPPWLVASIQGGDAGPSAAVGGEGPRRQEAQEEEEDSGGRRRRRRKAEEDPFLVLLREDMRYQREAEERRAREAGERTERLFALLERLIEK